MIMTSNGEEEKLLLYKIKTDMEDQVQQANMVFKNNNSSQIKERIQVSRAASMSPNPQECCSAYL